MCKNDDKCFKKHIFTSKLLLSGPLEPLTEQIQESDCRGQLDATLQDRHSKSLWAEVKRAGGWR